MRIGSDFDKMEFSWFGLDLLEPNALVSDGLITIIAFIFAAIVIRKFPSNKAFYKYWKWLFIIQGLCFLVGGMGHVLYNYTGVWGKFMPTVFATLMVMTAEHAMLTLIPESKQKLFMGLSKIKAAITVSIVLVLMFTIDVENNLPKLILAPSVNSTIGYFATLFFLGMRYGKRVSKALYLFPISVLILVPAGILQMMKINIHPWFDRNDAGHLLIIISLFLYYYAIKGYHCDTEEVVTAES
ncbi:hypothetical protein N9Y60_02990 [Crocinitomicaceae bacterium]|nr:hypothetical protein [Crocinitomicaceae bacterium]MDB3906734.1 hypothetical protein [Crocinitomicaceae bacterium]